MKTRPDLNKLAKEVYEANKAKGYHDDEISNETFLMLIITELSEAVEADRSTRRNKRANVDNFNNRLKHSRSFKGEIPEIPKERAYEIIYNETIKGSIEEELADTVIRLLDLAGLRGCEHLKDLLLCPTVSNKKSFPENVFAICTDLVYYKYSISERISFAILNLEYLCNLLSIDLWQHVELKLKYNKTRPDKHSKSY